MTFYIWSQIILLIMATFGACSFLKSDFEVFKDDSKDHKEYKALKQTIIFYAIMIVCFILGMSK